MKPEQSNVFPSRVMPLGKIRQTGKKQVDQPNQADLLKPDKVKPGNLPQDQEELL